MVTPPDAMHNPRYDDPMLMLIRGLRPSESMAAGTALREMIEAREPVAIVDGVGLEHASAGLDREGLLGLMEAVVDAHEGVGVRSFIVTVPRAWEEAPGRLAFFLKRRESQACAIAHFDQAPSGSIDPAALAAIRGALGDPASVLEPWAPEAPIIETERLVLTFPTKAQVDGFYDAIIGTSVFDTLCWDGPASREEMADARLGFKRECAKGPGHPLHLGIIEKASDRMVGAISLRPHDARDERADIGYMIIPASYDNGFATEAVGAIVDHAFTRRGTRRIEAEVFVGNGASRRVLEKLGFTLEGTKHANHVKRGRLVDEWMFALTRERWGRT